MSYNNKLLALIVCMVAAFCALIAKYEIVALVLAVPVVGLFINLQFAQRQINKDNSAAINAKYAEFKKALTDTHVLAIRKLSSADDSVTQPIVAKLIEAGSHVGSNPSWRSTQRIITASDIIAWYDAGLALVNEARGMIDSYVPRKGGIEGTLL